MASEIRNFLKNTSVKSDTFWLFLSRIVSAFGTSIFMAIIANIFGASQVGILTWIRNIGSILGIIGTVSAYANATFFYDTMTNRDAMGSSLLNASAILSVIIFLIWLPLYYQLRDILDCNSYSIYFVIGIIIVTYFYFLMLNSILVSLQKFKHLSAVNILITFALILGCSIFYLFDIVFAYVMILFWASYALGVALQLTHLIGGRSEYIFKYVIVLDTAYLKRLFKFLSAASLGEALYMIMFKMDVIVLSMYVSLAEVGIYGVGVLLSETLMYLPQTVKTVLLPRLGAGNILPTSKRFMSYYFFTVSVTFCGALFMSLVGHFVVYHFFGIDFISAYDVMVVLLFGIVARSGKAIIDSVLLTTKNIRFFNWCAIVSMLAFALLIIFLIPKYKLIGAALACTISYCIASFISHLYFFMKILPTMRDSLH